MKKFINVKNFARPKKGVIFTPVKGKIKNRKRTYHLRLERKDMDAFSNSLFGILFPTWFE